MAAAAAAAGTTPSGRLWTSGHPKTHHNNQGMMSDYGYRSYTQANQRPMAQNGAPVRHNAHSVSSQSNNAVSLVQPRSLVRPRPNRAWAHVSPTMLAELSRHTSQIVINSEAWRILAQAFWNVQSANQEMERAKHAATHEIPVIDDMIAAHEKQILEIKQSIAALRERRASHDLHQMGIQSQLNIRTSHMMHAMKGIKPCRYGTACQRMWNNQSCSFFHSEEDKENIRQHMAAWVEQEEKKARDEEQARLALIDEEFYAHQYVALGSAIWATFHDHDLSMMEGILDLIRQFCCVRKLHVFPSPAAWFAIFKCQRQSCTESGKSGLTSYPFMDLYGWTFQKCGRCAHPFVKERYRPRPLVLWRHETTSYTTDLSTVQFNMSGFSLHVGCAREWGLVNTESIMKLDRHASPISKLSPGDALPSVIKDTDMKDTIYCVPNAQLCSAACHSSDCTCSGHASWDSTGFSAACESSFELLIDCLNKRSANVQACTCTRLSECRCDVIQWNPHSRPQYRDDVEFYRDDVDFPYDSDDDDDY
jgi:hypothetical protein